MGDWWTSLLLFAQEAAEKAAEVPAGDGAAPVPPPSGPAPQEFLFIIGIMLFGAYFLLIRPEQRRSKQKQSLLGGLKKNDKVVTIGGIYGIVSNVKPDDDEVVIKIDEDKDVKIRVSKSSIAQVIVAQEKDKEKEA